MIEIEKKFKLNDDQIKDLVADTDEFLGEKKITDVYYDRDDHAMVVRHHWLRMRNGVLEFKQMREKSVEFRSSFNETEGAEQVFPLLGLEFNDQIPIEDQLLENGIKPLLSITTVRKSYRLGELRIDIDQSTSDTQPDFRFQVVEIELTAPDDADPEDLSKQIHEFAVRRGYSLDGVKGKVVVYFEQYLPEINEKFF